MRYYYQVEGKLRNNIGDVLQGYVAKRFLPADLREVVDREAVANMDTNNRGFLVANGWYAHDFTQYPVPENINPLYVAVHIANSAFVRVPAIQQSLMRHSPVGCRDMKTLKLLLAFGIPAYYSGCLTITLQHPANVSQNNMGASETILVDNVDHAIPTDILHKLENLLGNDLTRVSHDPPDPSGGFQEYAMRAEQHLLGLLDRYTTAKHVITTKIHCALPCLALGVPVTVIHPNPNDPRLETVRRFTKIHSYTELLDFKQLPEPTSNRLKLQKHQRFIERIVQDSVEAGENIVKTSKSPQYAWLRARSHAMAIACKKGMRLARQIPSIRNLSNRVLGPDSP